MHPRLVWTAPFLSLFRRLVSRRLISASANRTADRRHGHVVSGAAPSPRCSGWSRACRQAKPSQAKPTQVKSSQANSSQAKPSQAKSSQVKSSQVKSSQVKALSSRWSGWSHASVAERHHACPWREAA